MHCDLFVARMKFERNVLRLIVERALVNMIELLGPQCPSHHPELSPPCELIRDRQNMPEPFMGYELSVGNTKSGTPDPAASALRTHL